MPDHAQEVLALAHERKEELHAAFEASYENSEFDTTIYSVSSTTGATIENQFDDVDINTAECTGDQTVTYLSRYDAETYDGVYADAEKPKEA